MKTIQAPAPMLALLLASSVGCNLGVSHWPPAVSSKAEIEALPHTQTDVRGIDIGDQELQLIANRFQGLDYLYLNTKSRVSDFGISALSKSTNLHQVVIENGELLTDRSLGVLASLPSLRELIITNAPQLTDNTLAVLGPNPNLRLIYLFKCPGISSNAKSEFLKSHPKCQIQF